MNTGNLERYINDHLAGAAGALQLLDELAGRDKDGDAGFYRGMHERIKRDYELLRGILGRLELKEDHLSQAASKLSMKVGRLKLMWEGMQAGELGVFEALEMLVLGVSGKKLMWVALNEISPHCRALEETDFAGLQASAARQKEELEAKRREVIRTAFIQDGV